MIDFHGSTGYGQAFTDSISGDWGGKPLEDLQARPGRRAGAYSFLDGERVCALGASYGGYMINWIAGSGPTASAAWSTTTASSISDRCTTPPRSCGSRVGARRPLFRQPRGLRAAQPANHVDKWQTPMLVIHGELDYRVPVTQGIMTFTALQRQGIESRFLYFPDENHWVLKPHNSIHWHEQVNARLWLPCRPAPWSRAARSRSLPASARLCRPEGIQVLDDARGGQDGAGAPMRLAGVSSLPRDHRAEDVDRLVGADDLHGGRLADDGVVRPLETRPARRRPCGRFPGSRPLHHRTGPGRAAFPGRRCPAAPGATGRRRREALHVGTAATVEQAIALGQLERVRMPVLIVDRHHVRVAGQHHASRPPPDRWRRTGWPCCRPR
jgi:dienelactone hydrolase